LEKHSLHKNNNEIEYVIEKPEKKHKIKIKSDDEDNDDKDKKKQDI